MLDEQSAFAVEQIEIAIQALEKEISEFDSQTEKHSVLDLQVFPQTIKEQYENYESRQRQLNLLNAHASRINALRKELLKTEMRVRHKNKFFQRLSSAGDNVFPKRKELIKQISQQFDADVNQFIKHYFETEGVHESFYVLREEIKAFQGLAKILTLNTHSFTQTRMNLSKSWDRIKVEEKERKKERVQQRGLFKQNGDEVEKRIEELKQAFEANELTLGEAQKKMEEISLYMRQVELGREGIKFLRDRLNELRKVLQERVRSAEEAHQQQERDRENQKKQKFHLLKQQIEQLFIDQEEMDGEKLTGERDRLLAQIHDSFLSKNEKQELERLLKPVRDLITDKREKVLLSLSEDDRQALQQMQSILKQRKERRQEIKSQLDVLRKGAGSSSLDFEKAMNFTIQINEEKERLEKANQAIREIESKIVELQEKIS